MSKKPTRKLSLKQARFAKEYVRNGGIAYQAAITAGYSETTAHAKSGDWSEKVGIAQAIEAEQKIVNGPEESEWEETQEVIKQARRDYLDSKTPEDRTSARKDALNAADKTAKILGKYAPAKVELYVRDAIEREYAQETHNIIEELAGREVADEVMRRLANGV